MNRAQRAELARIVVVQVAELVDIVPDFDDEEGGVLAGVTRDEVSAQLGRWMARMPGKGWDRRLTPPPGVRTS